MEKRFLLTFSIVCIVIVASWLRLLPIAMLSSYSDRQAQSLVYYADAGGYHDFASQINKQGIGSLLVDDTDHSEMAPPTAFRTPLYPIFIAAISSMFGQRPEPVLLVQLLLDLCTMWLVYLIARRLSRSNIVATVAAGLYALNPLAIMYVSSAYAECFFSFFIVAGVYVFLQVIDAATDRERRHRLMLLGLVVGLGALAKPIGVYVILIYIIALAVEYRLQRRAWKQIAYSAAIALAIFAAALAPWQLRNLYVYGHYSLTFQQGREILVWRVELCRSGRDNPRRHQIWDALQAPYALSVYDYYKRSSVEQAAAIKYIRAHPSRMLGCHLAGVERFFFTDKAFFLDQDSSIRAAADYFLALGLRFQNTASSIYRSTQYLVYALVLAGFALSFADRRRRAIAILFACLVIYMSQMVSVDGYSRYDAPLQALYAILIAFAISYGVTRLCAFRSRAPFHNIRLRCRSALCRIFFRR